MILVLDGVSALLGGVFGICLTLASAYALREWS